MTLFLYNLALITILTVTAPWWLWKISTTRKYRDGLKERLGEVPASLARMRKHLKAPVIWLHAVSVGEVLAMSRLVSEMDWALSDYRLLISTTTRTGQDLARERFGANRVFYCPLDLPWAVKAYMTVLSPRVLILAESEFWPNMLENCYRRKIPVMVVNARVSDRSWPRYQVMQRLWKPLMSRLSAVLAQSEIDADRLLKLGCRPERVTVSGNLKFDVRTAEESDATLLLRNLAGSLRLIVAGSTLDGEEQALLDAWPRLLTADPQLVLILAPRHPERFGEAAELLEKSGIPWVRRSDWPAKPAYALEPLRPGSAVLLDTIGELASVYSLATLAFIGGSIVPSGGHNPLEPAQFAVPVVMGPHYANFRAITEDLRAHNAIRIAAKEELAAALIEMIQHPEEADAMGVRAKEVFDRQAGATDRCLAALRAVLAETAS
ncbi:MAG TPA: 3-deoxy-D-manno-octulosonic acid transferase [Terracidiphilus sp.]|nr:3-deoxy-D-manno-octulosonic acid transferase [Terracidiphilus sp.]